MSIDDNLIFDKIKKMDKEKAGEILISILLTSEDNEIKSKAIEHLISCEDNTHFDEIKSIFLNESHSDLKITLIEFFSKCYSKTGIHFLIPQYRSEKDWKVRKKIVESVRIGEENKTVPFFIEALSDPNIEVKKSAIVSLGNITAVEALDSLMDLLQYRIKEIHDLLINTIVKIGKKTDVNQISKYMNMGNLNIKKMIPLILGKIQDDKSVAVLIDLLSDENPIVRKHSVKALEKFIRPSDKNLKSIIFMLNDEDIDVKKTAIHVLGNIGSKKAINPLINLLKDKDKDVRNKTIKALDKILVKSKSFDAIYDILKKKDVFAKREAIKLLSAASDDPHALTIAIKLFNSKDSRIRNLALNAVLKILGNKLDEQIIEGLKAKEWQIRKNCAKILGEIREENSIDLLLNLLNDQKSAVRKSASNSLANFENSEIIKKVTIYLKDDNWRIRRAVVNVLIKIGTNEALEPLIACLNDKDSYIQGWAAKSLGKLKNIKDLSPIVQLLKNKDQKIRISAINALADIGDKKAVEPLINALGDDIWEVRKEIEIALQKIDPNWIKKI